MKLDPELETFFIAVALRHGTNPTPLYGFDRLPVAVSVGTYLQNNRKTFPHAAVAYINRTDLYYDPYSMLADKYLDWLYSQKIT